MATQYPPNFGVVTRNQDGSPLSPVEVAAAIAANRIPKSNEDEGYMTPDGVFVPTGSTWDDESQTWSTPDGGMVIPEANTDGGEQAGTSGSRIDNIAQGILGNLAFIVLGLILILLAFIMTDTGKDVTKAVATRGASLAL